MTEKMGQIIRRLRKERNLTQEELAELLNISAQAVSKWENGSSLPDVSLIVPIASVFGVQIDVLFGVFGISDDENAEKIIAKAQAILEKPLTQTSMKAAYAVIQEGLKSYPNHIRLLMQGLEYGFSLAYPENDLYDVQQSNEIYEECVRMAHLVTTYSKDITEVFRARMIMVMLHSAFGDFRRANEEILGFPERVDMSRHQMSAFIHHFEKDYVSEAICCKRGFICHVEAMLDMLTQLGCSYLNTGKHEDAEKVFLYALDMIKTISSEPGVPINLHQREYGDLYALLAGVCLHKEQYDEAVSYLEQMAEYDINMYHQSGEKIADKASLFEDMGWAQYDFRTNRKGILLNKLKAAGFEVLRDNPRYKVLIEMAYNLT